MVPRSSGLLLLECVLVRENEMLPVTDLQLAFRSIVDDELEREPHIPASTARNDMLPSGLRCEATSLFHSPKSKITAGPLRRIVISPSSSFA